jgi:type III secretion protein L
MVVWFRHGSCTVGVEDGVVRASDFAALTSLLVAADAVETERQAALDEAMAEAERWRDAMQQTIDKQLAAAAKAHKRGYADGLKSGREQAATDWAEAALRQAATTQATLVRQSDRIANIVALAVERVIEQEDRGALYLRAVRTVSKLMKDVPLLTLRVPQADHDNARQAVDEVLSQVGSVVPIEIVVDATLLEGSCLFESDQGVVDAGLATQLAAIRRAVVRAADLAGGWPDEEDFEEAEPPADELPVDESTV